MQDDKLKNDLIDYSRAIECIDDAFIILSPDGRIVKVNSPTTELRIWLNQQPQENDSLLDLLPKSNRQQVADTINQAIRTHEKQSSELERQDNTQKNYYEVHAFPILDIDNHLSHVFLVIKDITSRKVIEKRAQATASEMASIIETANAVILGIDSSGYVTDWNSRCTEITGFTKGDIYAQNINERILPEFEKERFSVISADIINGKDAEPFELRVNTLNNKHHTFLLSGTPRKTLAGDTIGILFVGEDITELSEYRYALEHKVQERTAELMEALSKEKELVNLKSRFVSIASHEFRTPLSSILFAIGYLEKYSAKAPAEEISEKIDSIKKNVRHMSVLLDDILTIGKSESGKIQVNFSSIAFERFLKSVIDDVRTASNNSHNVQISGEFEGLRLKSDEKLLRNIFINILGNAIKYSPGKAFVELDIHLGNGKLTTTVRDFGIGISGADLGKIFEPFQRASNTENIRGTGLGLSIVKKAIELLDGSIEVKSEPRKGSEFIITIPA